MIDKNEENDMNELKTQSENIKNRADAKKSKLLLFAKVAKDLIVTLASIMVIIYIFMLMFS